MKEVFKCREWRVMRWDEVSIKSQAWGCPCHPKKYPRGTSVKAWGCPRATPSSSAKIRSPFNTLYCYCFIFYAFCLERLYFCFQFSFVLFAEKNCWTPTNFFWRSCTLFFIAKNTLVFTLIIQRVFSFSRTVFSFHFFAMIFVQIFLYICIKVYLDLWSMLVFIKRVVSKRFEWCWKREKVFMPKLVQMGACLDCGLDFCMSCLMSFW
jgi:hypothetical protein